MRYGPVVARHVRGGRLLFVLNAGSNDISAFRIGGQGQLTAIGGIAGLPAGANGLVAF